MKSIGSRLSTLLSRMEDGFTDRITAVRGRDFPDDWFAWDLAKAIPSHLHEPEFCRLHICEYQQDVLTISIIPVECIFDE